MHAPSHTISFVALETILMRSANQAATNYKLTNQASFHFHGVVCVERALRALILPDFGYRLVKNKYMWGFKHI